ncbi:hypothetical protein AB3R30_17185 [Leptolyngbyaceae cyanobacterium UHCC 1019]
MTNFNKPGSGDRLSSSVPPQSVSSQSIDTQNIEAQSRLTEQRNYEAAQRDREDSNAFGGLLLGMLLTALVGLGVAAYYFLNNQRPNTTNIITPANPVTSPSPQVKERIIERDRIVPVPQQSAAPAPNVNVTIPNPVAPQAPAAQPAPEQRVQETTPDPVTPDPVAPAPVAPAPSGQ